MIKVSKRFKFETAHRLVKVVDGNYDQCANIHGHSWVGKVTLECDSLSDKDMSIDFSIIGKFCREIEARFDHKMLLWKNDPMIDKFIEITPPHGLVILDKSPTTEIIAEIIFKDAVVYFLDTKIRCRVSSVTIEETKSSECEYSNDNFEKELLKKV